jgi:hypothetical protein
MRFALSGAPSGRLSPGLGQIPLWATSVRPKLGRAQADD